MFTKYQYEYTLPQTNSTVKGCTAFHPLYIHKILLYADKLFKVL